MDARPFVAGMAGATGGSPAILGEVYTRRGDVAAPDPDPAAGAFSATS